MVKRIEQTKEEKIDMYMKCTKSELVEMLIACNIALDNSILRMTELEISRMKGLIKELEFDNRKLSDKLLSNQMALINSDYNSIDNYIIIGFKIRK